MLIIISVTIYWVNIAKFYAPSRLVFQVGYESDNSAFRSKGWNQRNDSEVDNGENKGEGRAEDDDEVDIPHVRCYIEAWALRSQGLEIAHIQDETVLDRWSTLLFDESTKPGLQSCEMQLKKCLDDESSTAEPNGDRTAEAWELEILDERWMSDRGPGKGMAEWVDFGRINVRRFGASQKRTATHGEILHHRGHLATKECIGKHGKVCQRSLTSSFLSPPSAAVHSPIAVDPDFGTSFLRAERFLLVYIWALVLHTLESDQSINPNPSPPRIPAVLYWKLAHAYDVDLFRSCVTDNLDGQWNDQRTLRK
jgi:hypothetical protein